MARVTYWRAVVFGRPQGPWRSKRSHAERDLIELGLGSFDESGQFYITVPADLQTRDVVEQMQAVA